MPGIFGAIDVPATTVSSLEAGFLRRWPDGEIERQGEALFGGHAFGGASAVWATPQGGIVGIDGEWSLYGDAPSNPEASETLYALQGGHLEIQTPAVGNIAVWNPVEKTLYLAVDASGTFPLYYAEHREGLLFSSVLSLLRGAIPDGLDDVAVLELLRDGYVVGDKTVFGAARRLLPGQALRYDSAARVTSISEGSRAWAGQAETSSIDPVDRAWDGLRAAARRAMPGTDGAVMMSAGWDSRTLLAAALAAGKEVTCYSHGDTKSRELRIVERLCETVSAPYQLEPIDGRVLDLDALRQGFDRTDNVVFPHWHRAGRVLSDQGIICVAAGVFGEIMGGHYGPAMLAGTAGKIRSVAGLLLGLGAGELRGDTTPRDFLRIPHLGEQWYLSDEYECSISDPLARMNAAIETAIGRLEARGVSGPLSMVEAFISEHRGSQYINAQLRSCRSFTDVAVPFAGGELFVLSTRVPLHSKVHNRLNQQMLLRHRPALLAYPMAATLIPARTPLFAQEVSRLFRKIYESGRMAMHRRTRGAIPRPRLGWVNFDFLRRRVLEPIVDDLRSDIWDRDAIRRRIRRLPDEHDPAALHPVFDQMSKVYTVDLLIR